MKIERTKIQIKGNVDYPQCAEVLIDGKPIHGVTAIRYEHKANELGNLTLDISGLSADMFRTDLEIEETANVEVRKV